MERSELSLVNLERPLTMDSDDSREGDKDFDASTLVRIS